METTRTILFGSCEDWNCVCQSLAVISTLLELREAKEKKIFFHVAMWKHGDSVEKQWWSEPNI